MSTHQKKQIEIINAIEQQVKENTLQFTTVSPVNDYKNDSRLCLTSVHFPKEPLLTKIQELIKPLKKIEPNYHYYASDNLHITIKNIRVINDPPHFTKEDIIVANTVFSEVVPQHHSFSIYFYHLLLFPNSLSLVGTTDPEFDNIVLDLDRKLSDAGIPDDKKYHNSHYFFCNVTIARFSEASENFKKAVRQLDNILSFDPYTVDNVTLLASNAVSHKNQIINSWRLES